MILHIPHSSIGIPDDVRSTFKVSDNQLQSELLKMTDWFTDELFEADDTRRLVYPVSRLVCDPERFAVDSDEPMASKGMGAIYTKTSEDSTLRPQLSAEERQHLLERFYVPHHAALEALVQAELKEQGFCLIIDCHSFSSVPLPHEPDQNPDRPQLCIGTDNFHTPKWLIQSLKQSAMNLDWTVEINRPFSGTIVPMSAYTKITRVFSVMLELNRSLYMDEKTGKRSATFINCRSSVSTILRTLLKTMQNML